MPDPFYIRQRRVSDQSEMSSFLEQCSDEARDEGAKHCRATHHPVDHGLVVFEAWIERPDDEGQARFSMVRA